jgi:hypothetical protein
MYDLIQQYFIDFEEASKITQISIGIPFPHLTVKHE